MKALYSESIPQTGYNEEDRTEYRFALGIWESVVQSTELYESPH